MASEGFSMREVPEREVIEARMIVEGPTYWRAPMVIAVLAWGLLLVTTFLVALGVVGLWSGAHVFSSAVFLIVGVMAGALGAQAGRPSPQPSPRGRGGETTFSKGRGGR
jgi:hypothetical protein